MFKFAAIAFALFCGTASAQVAGVGIGAEIEAQRIQQQQLQQQLRDLGQQYSPPPPVYVPVPYDRSVVPPNIMGPTLR